MTDDTDNSWLLLYAANALRTDRFADSVDHVPLLAAGLLGEAGSVLAELKKRQRERSAYPAFRRRMLEEVGDFLWYFVRIVDTVDRDLLREFQSQACDHRIMHLQPLTVFLEFGAAAGDVVAQLTRSASAPAANRENLKAPLRRMWTVLLDVAVEADVSLSRAAHSNLAKNESRWPLHRAYVPFFDEDFPEEEKLPRRLEVEFREQRRGDIQTAVLRCNGINFGDRLTDNIMDPDGYRYHDVFHFAYCVHLGWSPVVRNLLRCKRKSSTRVDEAQDGARAAILEEAVSAMIFSRAKQMDFFAGLQQLDYDLLKSVREFVQGYEVEAVPLWQWEQGILDGYRVFRQLRTNNGGQVLLDLGKRTLQYLGAVQTADSDRRLA